MINAGSESGTLPLVRRLVRSYLRPYFGQLVVAFLFMGAAAGMTGALASLMQPIIDGIFQDKNLTMLWPIAVAVFAAFTVRGVATFGHSVMMNRIGQGIVADVQRALYAHLLRLDLAFFHANAAGQLISRMTSDVNVMRAAVADCLTGIVRSTLTLVFLVGVMFYQDWRLAVGAFIVFPISAYAVSRLGKRLRRVSARTQEELGNFASLLNQTFQGARQVKAYGMEAFEEQRAAGMIDQLYRLTQKAFRVSAASMPITEALSGLAIVTVIVYGGHRVIAGESTTGALFSFITAFLLAYEPMKRLGKLNGSLQTGLAAAERVFALLDTEPQIIDRPAAKPLKVESPNIRFESVSFLYSDGTEALRDLSIEVPAGKTVALVGPSGAGKSTVLNLIPRFYDVSSGSVKIDGVDVRDLTLGSLRANVALVSQEVAIFDDTVFRNIAYGRAGAGKAEVIEAARAAAADDFITQLPQGYETRVGEHGVKLSGGQRQRIAIARAMLRNAQILLLDEATSALDAESERAVQDALRRLRAGRTTVVIAHRLSTVIDSDLLYVMDQGRIVETGSHPELLRRGGVYSRLYGLQAGPERATFDRSRAAG